VGRDGASGAAAGHALGYVRNMARIFDNIEQDILAALRRTLEVADRAGCVGYFDLRGWKQLDDSVEHGPAV
jgi:hypothetical protein